MAFFLHLIENHTTFPELNIENAIPSSPPLPPRRHHVDDVGAVAVDVGVHVRVLGAVEAVRVEVVVVVVEAVGHVHHEGDEGHDQGDQVEGVLAAQDAVRVDARGRPPRLGPLHVDERGEGGSLGPVNESLILWIQVSSG